MTHPTLRSLPPVGPASFVLADSQWDWIEDTLSKYADPSANVQWTIVVGHYPGWFPSRVLVRSSYPKRVWPARLQEYMHVLLIVSVSQ